MAFGGSMDINKYPGFNRTMGPGMVLSVSMDLEITMASGDSTGHSDQGSLPEETQPPKHQHNFRSNPDHEHPHELWYYCKLQTSTQTSTSVRLWIQTWPLKAALAQTSPWPQVEVQVIQIHMAPAVVWSMEINMASGGSADHSHMHSSLC